MPFRGCPLAFRVGGSGPPLILVQGVAAYGLTRANPQLEVLERQYSCLSFDNRGCGQSQPAGRKITIRQMAEDTLALMTEAGWESAHLVGHSLGGMVALQAALLDPQRVRSLALLCSFARGADVTARLLSIGLRMRFGSKAMREKAFLELVLAKNTQGPEAGALLRRMAAIIGHEVADVPEVTADQLAAVREVDFTGQLGQLAGMPTLVVNGSKDLVAPPAAGRALARGIPDARYIEVADASHAYPVLQAQECAELLLEHLAAAEERLAVHR